MEVIETSLNFVVRKKEIMNFNKLSDADCARILREYQRNQEHNEIGRENSSNVAGMMSGFLILGAIIAVLSLPSDIGNIVGLICVILAVFLAILSKIGSAIGHFNDNHHNPLH